MSEVQNKIELSQSTIATIKKLSQINQTLKLLGDSDTLRSKSESNVMFCYAPIEDKFPRDFHIYDVREFLSVVNIIENPILDFTNDKFVIVRSKDGKQKLRYLESAAQFVTSFTTKEPKLESVDFEVAVTEAQFKSVITAANTMRLEYIGFIGDGDKISIVAFNKNNGDEVETNTFSIELGDSDTDQPFRMFYKLETHKVDVLQGEGSLKFAVSSRLVSKVDTESKKTVFITMDKKSTFGTD